MNTIEKCREKQTRFADLVDFQNLFKSHLFDCFIISSLFNVFPVHDAVCTSEKSS